MTIPGDPRGRILVVDDEESIGRLLQRWLVEEGYAAEYANGFAQVEPAMSDTPFDLVTLDILMPGVDGLAVLAWLREHYPDVGVIMATGVDRLDVVLKAMRTGAIDYLLKPFSLELVSEQLNRAMERQRLLAENRAYQQDLERRVTERTAALAEAHARLARQLRELEARDRLVGFQLEAHTLAETRLELLTVLAGHGSAVRAVLYAPEPGADHLRAVAATGTEAAPMSQVTPEELAGLPTLPLADAEHPVVATLTADRPVQSPTREVILPLRYRDRRLGVVVLSVPAPASDETMNTLCRLAAEGAIALQTAEIVDALDSGELRLSELTQLE